MISKNKRIWKASIFGVFLLFVIQSSLFGFTLTVQEPNGAPVNNYRWLVEKDTTNYVVPGVPVTDSLSVNIHNSYAPALLSGHSTTSVTDVIVPSDTRYVVSVLPDSGYSISGNIVDVNQTTVTVQVSKQPVPTAQITVFAFNDNHSINNAPDAGEMPLEGFSVIIADIAGAQMYDVFGNMLGTTYQQDPNGLFILDGELFLHIDETKYVVERWRMDYNHYRPHSNLGYMTPAGFAELCCQAGCVRPQTPVFDGVQECGIPS